MAATRWSQSQLNTKSYKFTKPVSTYLLEKGMKEEEVDEAEQVQQDEEVEGKKRMMLCHDPMRVCNEELDLQNYQQNLELVAHKIIKDYDGCLQKMKTLRSKIKMTLMPYIENRPRQIFIA